MQQDQLELEAQSSSSDTSAEEASQNQQQEPEIALKKPSTAYFIFAAEKKNEMQGLGLKERAKAIGKLWGELTAEQKEVYVQKQREQKEAYLAQLQATGGTVELKRKQQSVPEEQADGYSCFAFFHAFKYQEQYQEELSAIKSTKTQMVQLWRECREKDAWTKTYAELGAELQNLVDESASRWQ